MSQRNIDFGSFPDDPSADAIRSAFQKTQENFAELFAGLEDQAVLSVNRTPGAGITVNAPTGNVVVTANIACVQVSTSTLSIGISANGSNSAILTSTNQVLVIDLPNTISNIANITISGNLIANNVSVNANTTTQSLTVNANASANNISILNNITGNSLNVYDATVSNLLTVTGGFQPIGDVVSSLVPANTTINVGSASKYYGNGYFVNLTSNGNISAYNVSVSNLLSVTGDFQPIGNVISDILPANTTIDIGNSSSYFGHGYFSNLSVTGNVLSNNLNANILVATSNLEATGNILANNVSVNSNTITNNLTVNLAFNGNTANLTGNLLVNNITNNNLIITNDLTLNANPVMAVGVITPTYGTQYLASNISVTGTSSSNSTTILSFTIPNQGIWQIDSQLISSPSLPPSNANLSFGVYYSNGTLVANSEILTITSTFGSPTPITTSSGKTIVTTSGPEILSVRGWAQGSLAQVLDYGANGRSSVSWLRLDAVATISTSSNVTFGNATVTGNLTAGNISGNITGNFSGVFANGTSNVAIPVPNGNVNISVGGVSNVLVTTSTGINVAGTIQSTGNINTNGDLGVSGNAVISGNLTVDGNLIYVNVDQLDVEDPIINLQVGPNGAAPVSNSGKDVGTALNYFDSSAKIAFMGWDTSNAEIAFGSQVSITSEVVTFTQLANIRSGNASLGNLITANFADIASNIISNNFTVNLELQGNTANFDGNVVMDSWLTVANTANVGNLRTNNLLYANGTPWDLQEAAGNTNEIQFNTGDNFGASSNLTYNDSTQLLTVLGNSQFNNANLGNLATANYINVANDLNVIGNISAANINANITGNFSGELSNGTSNVNIPVVNANVNISAAGNANVLTVSGSGVEITGTLNATGNANTGNLGTTNLIATTVQGSLTTNSQPNITSLGTLSSLAVTGNITSGNANLGNLASANYIAGTLTTASQPNITSVGTLSSLMSSGNVQSNGTVITNAIEGRTTGVSITAVGTNQNITLVPTGTGSVDVSGFTIINVDDPVNVNDATNKQYVDGVAQGLSIKPSCNVATTTTLAVISGGTITYNNGVSGVGATLTTTGSYSTIDGVSVTNGMRILVKDEATAANNGIYVLTNSTTLTRATDFDTPGEMVAGVFTFISSGSTYSTTGWVSTLAVATVGTSPVNWSQFSGAGTYTAGTGLTLVGSQFRIANTAVTTATYGNGDRVGQFTVNQQGQLTGASNVVIAANAANLTGTTLASSIVTSSLTSVGTLGSLTVSGNISSGNANLGNTATANFFSGDGGLLSNISAGAAQFIANGTSNVRIPTASGNVNTSVGGVANVFIVTSTGANVTGILGVSGNANTGNLGTNRVLASGNITTTQFISNIATGTAPIVVSSTTLVSNLNADLLDGYNSASANTGSTIALRDTNGNLSANFFIGNGSQLTGLSTSGVSNGTSNVSIPSTNGNVNTSVGGVANVLVVTITGANVTGNIEATNRITAGNFFINSVQTGIIAAGTTSGTASQLDKTINEIISSNPGGNGVVLPGAVAGMTVYIINKGSSNLNVYPGSGRTINSLGVNQAFTHVPNATLHYIATTSTQWYTVGATYA